MILEIPVFIAILGLLCLGYYLLRSDFERYSIRCVGVYKRVRRVQATDTEFECTAHHCESTVVDGEERIYHKEIVIFGSVLLRYGGQSNFYCSDHVSFEFQQHGGEQFVTTTERVGQTVLSAVIGIFVAMDDGVAPKEKESDPFDSVTTSVGSAFSLLPVVLLVLIAAIIITFVRGLGGSTVEQ